MTLPDVQPERMSTRVGWRATVGHWGRMVKLSHSVFALPFALMATFLAARSAWLQGHRPGPYPSVGQLGLILLCMVAARAVAMTFNRLVDARFDQANPRTATRHLPAGLITPGQATAFLLLASLVFILGCVGFGWGYDNWYPLLLALPVLGYLCFYSYTKRFTRWSHFVLGSAIALSPVAAWLAIHPESLGIPALLMMGIVTFWIGGFDIIYACQDIDFDRHFGLHSLPARLGPASALWIARGAHLLTVILLVTLGLVAELGILYAIGVALVAALLLIENALVRPHDFTRINLAFFTINGLISLALGLLTILDVLL